MAIVLGISIASPIAFASWTFVSKSALLLAAILPVYFQFYKKGFRQIFILITISYTVIFGIGSGMIFVFGDSFGLLLGLGVIGYHLAESIFYPAFEQAKLMSNYDLKKLSSKKL